MFELLHPKRLHEWLSLKLPLAHGIFGQWGRLFTSESVWKLFFSSQKADGCKPPSNPVLFDVSQARTRNNSRMCCNTSVDSCRNMTDKPQCCVIFLVPFSHLPLSGSRKFCFSLQRIYYSLPFGDCFNSAAEFPSL